MSDGERKIAEGIAMKVSRSDFRLHIASAGARSTQGEHLCED